MAIADLPKVIATPTGNLTEDVTAETPRGMTDVRVIVMPVLKQIFVRVTRTYLQSFLGFLGASMVGAIPEAAITPNEAVNRILVAGGLALFPTFVSLCQNGLELLTKWDAQHPELRA